jgi:hypothetical protein
MHFLRYQHQESNLNMPINAFKMSKAEPCVTNMQLGYCAFKNNQEA